MKSLKLACAIALIALFFQNTCAQSNEKHDLQDGFVKSLIVKGKTLEILKNLKQEVPSFTIDSKGRLTPAKGFVIRYVKKFDKFYITQNKDEIVITPLDGTADLGHGITLNCYSNDNCRTCLPDYVGGMYYCKSNGCSCYGEIIMPPSNCIPEYLHE